MLISCWRSSDRNPPPPPPATAPDDVEATIRDATRILVFDHGRIIESGTFDELVARSGRFAELAQAQFLAAEPAAAVPEAQETLTAAE